MGRKPSVSGGRSGPPGALVTVAPGRRRAVRVCPRVSGRRRGTGRELDAGHGRGASNGRGGAGRPEPPAPAPGAPSTAGVLGRWAHRRADSGWGGLEDSHRQGPRMYRRRVRRRWLCRCRVRGWSLRRPRLGQDDPEQVEQRAVGGQPVDLVQLIGPQPAQAVVDDGGGRRRLEQLGEHHHQRHPRSDGMPATQPSTHPDRDTEFFPDLADGRPLRGLPGFHLAAGQLPASGHGGRGGPAGGQHGAVGDDGRRRDEAPRRAGWARGPRRGRDGPWSAAAAPDRPGRPGGDLGRRPRDGRVGGHVLTVPDPAAARGAPGSGRSDADDHVRR